MSERAAVGGRRRVRREGGGEQWMVLHPGKFNKHVQYAWRFDPSELSADGQFLPPTARKPPPRECFASVLSMTV